MTNSILDSTKKTLGLDPSYDAFDIDVMMHINTALSTLNQLGLGPEEGFMIEDNGAEWDEFLEGDPNRNAVKSYVYLRVRVLFDPPSTSFVLTALQEQIKEMEWRLNVYQEGKVSS